MLRSDLPIIDLHMHLSRVTSQSWLENVPQIEQTLKDCSLAAVNVQNIVLWPAANLARNPLTLLLKLRNPGTVFGFGGIRYPEPDSADKRFQYADQARQNAALGFDGIKLFGKPNARHTFGEPLDSPLFDDMFSWLEESGTPVLYHIGDPPEFWDRERISESAYQNGWYYGPDHPSYEDLYREVDGILTGHPRLRVIFPHFYFLSQDLPRLGDFLERWPSVSIDITPGTELYFNLAENIQAARDFFLRFQDRILFGTDNTGSPHGDPSYGCVQESASKINSIRSFLEEESAHIFGRQLPCLALPKSVLRRIYADNFRAFVSERPKPVEKDGVLAYAGEMRALAGQTGDHTVAEILTDTLTAIERGTISLCTN